MALSVSASVLVGTATMEDWRGTAYPDPATKGAPWTIGFGETEGVKPGDKITVVRSVQKLGESLDKHAAGVRRCITVPLSQGEFDASVDLAYNIGVNAFCKSGVVEKFNAGDYAWGCMRMLAFIKARVNGQLQVMNGLVKRRWENYYTCLT